MSEDTVALHKFNGKQYALARDVQPYFMELANARKRIETLEKALLPFAKAADALDEEAWDNLHIEGSNADITGEHCRAARAALEWKDER